MKKCLFTCCLLIISWVAKSQILVSGGTTGIGNYSTLSAAINALNTGGALTAPVFVDIPAGYTETLSSKVILTMTGTAANTITIQKSGSGANPLFTSYVGTVATPSVIADGFFVIAGGDYITIDGIDLQESSSNTTTTTVMEFGFGLFKASPTDGAQYNTIKNCTITLNRVQNGNWTSPGHTGSIGITVNNGLYTATGVVTVTAASGSNSFNKFYSNTIQNCNVGISFVGWAAVSPFLNGAGGFGDTGNDVGGSSLLTGNTILNFGGGASAANPATGIFSNQQWDFNCSNNNVNSNNGAGVNHPNILRGIFLNISSTSASVTCNNNTVSVKSAATTNILVGIDVSFGSTAAGNTINVTNNTVQNCTYSTATTGTFQGIITSSSASVVNINNNTITGNSLAGTGQFDGITLQSTPGTANINQNTVSNNSKTSTGTFNCIITTSTPANTNIGSNIISGNSLTGGGATSTLYGIRTNTSIYNVSNNSISNLSLTSMSGTVSGNIYGIYNASSPTNETINNNTINNLTMGGTSTSTSNTIRGIYLNTNSTSVKNINSNTISGLNYSGTSGAATVQGIYQALGATITMTKNKIYDLSSNGTGAVIEGITLISGTTIHLNNNLIGNFSAPSATGINALLGINCSGTGSYNIFHNTIYLNASSSSATTFGSTCINFSSTATSLNLRNNNLVNLSTPAQNGANVATNGIAACLRRSGGTTSTIPANYATTSNNNNFWCNPTSGSNNHMTYVEGTTTITNPMNTISQLKSFLLNRDQSSIGENCTFFSTTGSSPLFLHLDLSVPTQLESGGQFIATVTDDIDGDTRNTTTPDIGADEFNGIGADLSGPVITFTDIPNTICVTDGIMFATINDPSLINVTTNKPRLWFKKSSENNAFNGNTSSDNGWKYVEALNGASPFQFSITYALLNSPLTSGDVIQYFFTAEDLAGLPNVSINSGTFPLGYIATSVALSSGAFPLGGTIKSFTILPEPVTVNSVASVSSLCISGNVNLSLAGDISTGAYYQWQSSPMGLNTWTDIAGATSATYLATGVSSSSDFRCEISCGDLVANGGTPIAINNSTPVTVIVNSPTVLTTTDGSRCGPGVVTLSATANVGSTLNWYSAATGGSPLSSGNSFTTPSINATTNYYVSASQGGISGINVASPTATSSTFFSTATGWGLRFTVNTPCNITSVKIKASNSTAGTATMQIKITDLTDAVLYTGTLHSFPITTSLAEYVIPVNISLPVGSNYKMVMTSSNISSLVRESTGVTFPYNSPGNEVSITAGANGVTTAQTTAAYYWFYNWVISTGCESARTQVVANLTAPPTIAITGASTVECSNAIVSLSKSTVNTNDFDTYVWSPSTNLFTDPSCSPGFEYTGTSSAQVWLKSSTAGANNYTLTASNSVSGCSNFIAGTTTYLPGASLTITGNSDICISGSKTLSLSSTVGLSASNIQWNMNGNPISGANSLTYSTGTLTNTTNYSVDLIDGNSNICLTTPTVSVLVNNPVVTGTVPGSRCGVGTVNLSASATGVNGAPTYKWYSAASGGSPLYSGPLNTFTTPVISSTTDFYVAAAEGGGGNSNVGAPSNGQATGYTLQAGLLFDVFAPMTLNGVYVYPIGTGAGTINVALKTNSGTVLESTAFNTTATASPGIKTYIPLNWNIQPGTQYWLDMPSYSGAITTLIRDASANIVGGPIATNPAMTIPGVMTITSGRLTASGTSTTYYFFYDWSVSTGCESARQAVTATVNSAPTISVTSSSSNTCIGNQIQLSASSSNPDYTYSWTSTPAGFTATGAGPFNTTIGGNTTFNVTAIDNTTGTYAGCGAIGSTIVTSVPNVLSLSVNATPSTVCNGSNSQLEAIATIPASGYAMNASCNASFVDISTTGTSVGTLGDDLEYNVTIPSFTYNGVAYTSIRLGTNGVIAFGATTGDVPTGNTVLPATITAGNNFLAPYWDDLDVNLGGTIKTQTVGNTFIIQYTNIDHNLFTTGGITFQVQLDLTTGVISYVYQDVVFGSATYDNGLTATVGLQTSATNALQYSFNTASLTNGQSICFTPLPTTPTVTYDWAANPTYLSATNIANPIATGISSNQTYTVVVTDANGCTKSATKFVDVVNCSSTLNLTLFLQGYYIGSNTMAEVMANQGYLPSPAVGDCDDITVELHDATTTTTIAGTTTARLHADGTASAVFTPGVTGNYYIVIKHRNSLQTWSTDPVTLASTSSYNFTTAATQAYADQLVEVEPGVWALYTGDLNQDDYIDSFDFPIFDLDATNGVSGVYVATDMNGDGYVDPFDFPVFDINSFNGITASYP